MGCARPGSWAIPGMVISTELSEVVPEFTVKDFCFVCTAPLTEKAKLVVEEKKKTELKDLVEELIKKRMDELESEKKN